MRPYWKGYLKLALVSCPIARAQIPDSNDGGFPDPHPGGWDHLAASGHQGIWLHRLSNRPKSH